MSTKQSSPMPDKIYVGENLQVRLNNDPSLVKFLGEAHEYILATPERLVAPELVEATRTFVRLIAQWRESGTQPNHAEFMAAQDVGESALKKAGAL